MELQKIIANTICPNKDTTTGVVNHGFRVKSTVRKRSTISYTIECVGCNYTHTEIYEED